MVKEHFYKGTLCHIEQTFIEHFEKIVKEFKPEMIVELGTCTGGMTKYFTEWFPKIPIYSVDAYWLVSKEDEELFRSNNVGIIITSQIFKSDILLPTILSLPLKKFLFCDDGYRVEEFKLFAGYLRPGDLLGVHDWNEELKMIDVKHILEEFLDHPINKFLDENGGISCCRFWNRKGYDRSAWRTPPKVDFKEK